MSKKILRLHIVGDSISIGYGRYLEKYIDSSRFIYSRKEGIDEACLNLDIPKGANGGDSSMVKFYLEYLAEKNYECDCLLVNCGLHDIKFDLAAQKLQVRPEQYRKNLLGIIAISKKIADSFIWITTTPSDETVHNTPDKTFFRYDKDNEMYRQIARKTAEENSVALIDLYRFTRNLGGKEIFSDHVHFQENIRALQAAFIAGWLENYP